MTSPRETVLCQYHYDPLDRLTSHALPDIPERQRFYCKSRLVTEIQGAMRYSIVQHGDQLLAQQQNAGDALDTTLMATDQQRSVLHTLKANHQQNPIAYTPYGHRAIEHGLLSLLGFTGERPDPVTGCYLLGNGYRAFNPVLMRFNSSDSLSPFGNGGLNSYAYCQGDPVNFYDPNGHFKFRLFQWTSNSISKKLNLPRYRSSPATTHQTLTIIKKNTLEISKAQNSTQTIKTTTLIDGRGDRHFLQREWINSKYIQREASGQGITLRKTNPSLQELSLKKLPEVEYQALNKNFDIQKLDATSSGHSIYNRATEIKRTTSSYSHEQNLKLAFTEAMNGKIRGVDPRQAKTLHDDWQRDPRLTFQK